MGVVVWAAMTNETGFWRFLLSFTADWLSAMSGGLSVPLTIAAVFIPGTAYKVALATLAVIALVGSSYRVWRNERRRAVEAEARLDSGAEIQAKLARAELDARRRASEEEEAHKRWTENAAAEMRKPGGPQLVQVQPGEQLHADWAIHRRLLDPLETSSGPAVILPAAERWANPGSPERKVRSARKEILTTCATRPAATFTFPESDYRHDWESYLAAAEELHDEGLVKAQIGADRIAISVRITVEGQRAIRRGAF